MHLIKNLEANVYHIVITKRPGALLWQGVGELTSYLAFELFEF